MARTCAPSLFRAHRLSATNFDIDLTSLIEHPVVHLPLAFIEYVRKQPCTRRFVSLVYTEMFAGARQLQLRHASEPTEQLALTVDTAGGQFAGMSLMTIAVRRADPLAVAELGRYVLVRHR